MESTVYNDAGDGVGVHVQRSDDHRNHRCRQEPKVNAGSETYPLDVAAAWSADSKFLTLAILNPDGTAHDLSLSFKGVEFTGTGNDQLGSGG